ncbi:MAG: hypothetical protein J3Q66DRAFT_321301 [Benniella sp.]|nr:MAG: hypothetical protein J3Q66DRAFT_321301 [Benniella sp.]
MRRMAILAVAITAAATSVTTMRSLAAAAVRTIATKQELALMREEQDRVQFLSMMTIQTKARTARTIVKRQ